MTKDEIALQLALKAFDKVWTPGSIRDPKEIGEKISDLYNSIFQNITSDEMKDSPTAYN